MRSCFVGFALLFLPAGAAAQSIAVRTVPVAAGDQFLLFPGRAMAMGGVGIALDDSLADPFTNPAKGARLPGSLLLTSPGLYNITRNVGHARTLPVGALFAAPESQWFGGAVVALQQLQQGDQFCCAVPLRDGFGFTEQTLSDRASGNLYALGMLGRRLDGGTGRPLSIGASIFVADLTGMDGVDLLYAGAQDLDQFGHALDARIGLSGELEGDRTFEVVVLHSRLDMTHDVTYVDFSRIDGTPSFRDEVNLDQTNTWGLHGGYVMPLEDGLRLGFIATINRKSHPKIPNYELQNIPRDPGTTWAYNLGIGLASAVGPATFAIDAIFEPIRSYTWADSPVRLLAANGTIIDPGEKTIENRFRFANALLRLGLARSFDRVDAQLGLQMRSINYTLRQRDNVRLTRRTQREHWFEWTPTWGLGLTFPEFRIGYVGRATLGTGRPGIAWTGGALDRVALQSSDVVLAPSGPLTLQDVAVVSHQLAVTVPFGRR